MTEAVKQRQTRISLQCTFSSVGSK